jgi:hypothetical protein
VNPKPFARLLSGGFAIQAGVLVGAILIITTLGMRKGAARGRRAAPSVAPDVAGLGAPSWAFLALATTLMCTSASAYVSRLIPKITLVSFAWRWQVIACALTAMVVAIALERLRGAPILGKGGGRLQLGVICALLLGLGACSLGGVIRGALHRPTMVMRGFPELGFYPVGATLPEWIPSTPQAMLLGSSGSEQNKPEVVEWGPLVRRIVVHGRKGAILRLRTYWFPGWFARIDGQPVPIGVDRYGAQQMEVPAGTHEVTVAFGAAPARTAGAAVSLIAGFLILVLLLAP